MKVLLSRVLVFSSLLLVLLGLGSSTVITVEDNIVYWKEGYRLKWSDFKGKADKTTQMQALTFSSVKVHTESEGSLLKVEVICFFDRNQSWAKDTGMTGAPLLLKHEQLHFDITELYARMIRQKVSLIKETNPQKKMNLVSQTVQSVMKDCMAEQNKYDNETQHGIIEAKQNEWIAAVKKRMAAYAAFKSK